MAETPHSLDAHRLVSREQWISERTAFLAKEKEFTMLRDEISRQRRELPWEEITKRYVFDGPAGRETLRDLFEGRSQLITYHFMCIGCVGTMNTRVNRERVWTGNLARTSGQDSASGL